MTSSTNLLKTGKGQTITISSEGLQSILQRQKNKKYPSKDLAWTDDFRVQLPIKRSSQGTGSLPSTTLIDQFRRSKEQYKNQPALSVKRNGKWQTINYQQYYNQCMNFAASLIAFGAEQYTSINIIGFNAPQWSISFFGSLFCRCLPSGIYTTNNETTCQYIAENSECRIVVSENLQYAKKYQWLLENGKIKLIVIYNDPQADLKGRKGIISWKDFMREGERVDKKHVEERMDRVRPGNCCTLVYTSGTTGMPKGVMLSHDNFTWTYRSMSEYQKRQDNRLRIVSYLPLSHVAGMFSDITTTLIHGYHVHFASPDALQGSLIQTLKQVRPNAFFSVPRVWQKIDQKMKEVARNNGWLKTKIATWAKSIGAEGTMQQIREQPTSWQFKLARLIVYNPVKKNLGLDECKFTLFGAAPLDPQIRHYFLTLNIFLINSYGMSESTGPQNFSNKDIFNYKDLSSYKEVGSNIPGTQIKIHEPDKFGEGQICYRGRNVFMGYYKNPEETHKCIDDDGFLHSGDVGRIDQNNVLYITGRVKELIITAGGQNIPPVLIENDIKLELPFLANIMVVGDMRKYLTCLISVKEDPPASGIIEKTAKQYLQLKNCQATKIAELRNNQKFRKVVMEGLKKANLKAISRAQHVQQFYLLPEDFSVENGMLTPTLKLKRKVVSKKYEAEIEGMYQTPKL